MQLHLDDDQSLFVETTRRFLADTSDIPTVRALADTDRGFDADWWANGAQLGWTSVLAPERMGGGGVSGGPVSDLAQIAFERGRVVAPGPFASVNAVVAALASSGGHDGLLTRLIDGSSVVTLAASERGVRWLGPGLTTSYSMAGDGVEVTGEKITVESGPVAEAFVVLAAGSDGDRLVVVPADADGVEVAARRSPDLVRRFADVTFRDVRVSGDAVLDVEHAELERVLDIATVLQLAETVGALDRVLEFTIEWASDRYSFGRPLNSYQELKHRFADMTLWLEGSKATVTEAAEAFATQPDRVGEYVSAAASYVHQHGPELVQDCVQMHGGIGVTWEHDIHLYLRRVTLNSLTCGTVADHRERLASMILEGAGR